MSRTHSEVGSLSSAASSASQISPGSDATETRPHSAIVSVDHQDRPAAALRPMDVPAGPPREEFGPGVDRVPHEIRQPRQRVRRRLLRAAPVREMKEIPVHSNSVAYGKRQSRVGPARARRLIRVGAGVPPCAARSMARGDIRELRCGARFANFRSDARDESTNRPHTTGVDLSSSGCGLP